jgi:restriction system protein
MPRYARNPKMGCQPLIAIILIPFSIFAASTSIWFALLIIVGYTLVGWAVYKYYKIQRQLNDLVTRRQLQTGIKEIDVMTGIEFEHYLKTLFGKLGYTVNITKASGDFGADLVISKYEQKIVVQAKRYYTSIGIKAIQEVHGSKQYYGATEAWVVTNSSFTEAARQLAEVNGVVLIDRNRLIELILSSENQL